MVPQQLHIIRTYVHANKRRYSTNTRIKGMRYVKIRCRRNSSPISQTTGIEIGTKVLIFGPRVRTVDIYLQLRFQEIREYVS